MYQLCDKITLKKIDAETYRNYIQKVARKTWKKQISNDVIDNITLLTERHPRRIYQLCFYLWRLADINNKIPTTDDIKIAWNKLIQTELKGVRYYLSKRSTGQLKILTNIALGHNTALTSKHSQRATDLTAGAISKAAQHLTEDDLIEQDDQGVYHIIDPVVRTVLAQYETALLA